MFKLTIFLFSIFISTHVYAGQEYITPFGASCPSCATYGYCQRTLTNFQAENNLREYYERKGLNVAVVKQFGRFLEANVYKKDALVEKIILDRRTGRIKPID